MLSPGDGNIMHVKRVHSLPCVVPRAESVTVPCHRDMLVPNTAKGSTVSVCERRR